MNLENLEINRVYDRSLKEFVESELEKKGYSLQIYSCLINGNKHLNIDIWDVTGDLMWTTKTAFIDKQPTEEEVENIIEDELLDLLNKIPTL